MDSLVRYGDFPSKSPHIEETHTHTHVKDLVREGKHPGADEADAWFHNFCIYVQRKNIREKNVFFINQYTIIYY